MFRLVEGNIFRIGMHLEDIKEMIDRNVCEQISPPHSSSTPMPIKEMLHVKPSPTSSPPPTLHEVTTSRKCLQSLQPSQTSHTGCHN